VKQMPDREKVIKGLEGIYRCISPVTHTCGDCPYQDNHVECQRRALSDAIALLKEQGWNLFTEDDDGIIHGLPGDDGQYIMTDGKDIWIDEYVDGVTDGIFLDSGRDIREIKAWMYMPELPKTDRR